jgi:YD repeat-containing protein
MASFLNFTKFWQLCLIGAICVGCIKTATGQSSSASSITSPTVIPPSPDAQAFMRYGEYPVDYSTGVPKIDIPLYEIKSGHLSLPISLSYHASGIRVGDISSVVGLGWKLNAGGVFTRTVKGLADESAQGILTQGYFTQSQISNLSLSTMNFWLLENFSKGAQDSESDNYYYSTSDGLSGQFVYDNLKNIVPLSYTTDKFIKHPVTNICGNTYNLEVIKDDGISYLFDQQEQTLYNSQYYPSSWWLSKIISADRTDSITFEYQPYAYEYPDYFLSESWTYGVNSINTGSTGLVRSMTNTMTKPLLLTKINFRNGYIQFDYTNDRKDMRDSRLTAVSVYNNINSLPIKKYQLNQSYFYSGYTNTKSNYRLKLDTLKVYDGNGSFLNNYAFSYNQDNILPPYIVNGSVPPNNSPSYAVDYWGYYNGQIQNTHMIPYLQAPDVPANRTPDATYAKACILNKITYPTGGYSQFEYDSNVKYDGSISGGLRIKRITSRSDINSVPIVKRYEYTNNLLGRDIVMDAEGMYNYTQQMMYLGGNCFIYTNNSIIYMDNPVLPLLNHNGSPALYQIVDEYTDGGSNSLKTEYTYDAQPDIVYSVTSPRYQNQYYTDRSWRRGLLLGTSYFKLVNGIYKSVKSINNTYGDYRTSTIIAGTKVQQIVANLGNFYCNNTLYTTDFYQGNTPFSNLFYYFDVTLEVGIKKVINQSTTEYDDNNNTVSITRNFTYGSPYHLFPTTTDYIDSKGESYVTQLKYPHDFAGTGVYDAMIASNRISPVIQQLNYKGSSFLQSEKTNYKNWFNNIIAPETVETQVGSNGTETRLHYYAYDNSGNILTVSKEKDTKVNYLWGYNFQYPVAKIVGNDFTTAGQYINLDILNNTSAYTDDQVRAGLNNLRSSLTGSLVTTYTYKPIVGMTSQTDPSGKITFYEYDGFQRLKTTKDQNGNIIKQYDYHYKQ